jgi:hypothetical protein
MRRAAAAIAVSAVAFGLYHATLLPGFDFGDTGSFQTVLGAPVVRARDAYPLYFAIGRLFLWATRADPAYALNLASAVQGAVACGLLVLLAEELSGSLLAGAGAAVIFAVSYTFWSQAIIAEVYALHIVFVAGTLLLLLRWQRRPSLARLSAFFAVYALGFGNHLSMILLAPAYVVFLLSSAPGGWRSMFAPRVVGLAVVFAVLGAAQYLWSLESIWTDPQPTHGIADALSRFWFDVTKPDWRDTMVMNVPWSMLPDHLRMYWFDLRQQFGPALPIVAAAGFVWLSRLDLRRGALLLLVYLANALFAFSYNVGDTHVFYLPAHMCIAVLVATGVAAFTQLTGDVRLGAAAAIAAALYGVARMQQDYPALDRSRDDRPAAIMRNLSAGLQDRRAVLLADTHWQIQNGVSYFANQVRPGIEYARMPDVLLYAPVLVRDNAAIGREVTATSRARDEIASAYGPLFTIDRDPRAPTPSLSDVVQAVPAGTRYVLCVLKPIREFSVDVEDVDTALEILTDGAASSMPPGQYAVVAGLAGARPALMEASNDPFSRSLDLSGVRTTVRMEAWLNADTIRRMGFGHVIAARQHTLIVERGVSFVAFDDGGRALSMGYAGNIFAPLPRYLIKIARDIVGP